MAALFLLATVFTLVLRGLASCIPQPGTNGPQWAEPQGGSGACFQVDLMDGLDDSDELLLLFECFNTYGAFDALEPLVTYLATSANAQDFLDLANQGIEDPDLVAKLELAARLLESPDQPLDGLLDIYTELYESDLLARLLAVEWELADQLLMCQESADPFTCSVPDLLLALLDTDIPDTALGILEELADFDDADAGTDTGQEGTSFGLLDLLYQTSTLSGQESNQLLDLLEFMLREQDGAGSSPLEQLLPYLRYFLGGDMDGDGDADPKPSDDDFIAALAPHLARLWRQGKLQQLPEQLMVLNTYDSQGSYVGFDGESIMDEIMALSAQLGSDTSLLYEEFTIPGSSSPTTVLELVLDTLDGLYLNEADVNEIITQLEEMVEGQLCAGTASSELCDLLQDVLPPMSAAAETGIMDLLLPVVYVAHDCADFDQILAMSDLALSLDLLGRTEFLTRISLENGLLDHTLAYFPLFIHEDLGTLSNLADQSLELLRFFMEPWAYDTQQPDRTVVPLLLPRDLLLRMLDPQSSLADPDYLLGWGAQLLQDETSSFYLDDIQNIVESLQELSQQESMDPEQALRDFLGDEALRTAALRLGADVELLDLLTPADNVRGAPWYLYDLVQRGLLARLLDYAAALLDMLVDQGWLEPWEDSGDSTSAGSHS